MDPHWSLACVRAPPILHHIWHKVNTDVVLSNKYKGNLVGGGGGFVAVNVHKTLGKPYVNVARAQESC